MTSIKILPTGKTVAIQEGQTILQALNSAGVIIKQGCGGHASCTDCKVKIISGEDYLSPPPFVELKVLGNVFHITKERLACQTCVSEDVTLEILNPEISSPKKKTVKKNPVIVKKKDEKNKKWDGEPGVKKDKDPWFKHWDKDNKPAIKKLAGGKRPKFFSTDEESKAKKS